MNFELNEEQRALQDSLERLLSDRYGHEQRQVAAGSAAGYSEDIWTRLAELGITALPIAEDHGGLGGSSVDMLPVMQAFGRALLSVPVVGSIVLAGTVLQRGADESNKGRWLPALAAGSAQLAWAHDEAGSHSPDRWIASRATLEAGVWTLSGTKINVLYAGSADHYLVSARVGGENESQDGRALFLVDPAAPGVNLRHYRLIDDTPAAELRLDGAPATPLSPLTPLPAAASHENALDAALAAGVAAACADMAGAMEAAFGLTVEYLNTRKQFGRLIGENQALRHRVAEMLVSLEMARSMAIAAAVAAARPHDLEARRDLHRAKLLIGRHARSLCHTAIQLHGGIGMTEEYAVGHYLRRVHVMDQMFGDCDAHAERLAEIA